jgi:asparagine synthase (glutamine-hydrolysing)
LIAVLNRNGREPDPGLLGELLGAVSERGSDRRSIHLDGHFGIGFAARHTTPEDAAHPRPATDSASGACAFMDGRLDDRERLARSLPGARPEDALTGSDAQLALAAYLALGPGFAARLLGDFALVIWDPREHRLVCVRDASGIRPLYYAATDDCIVVGSNLKSVLLHPAVPRLPNPGMIGEYLAFGFSSLAETLYAAVRRLPPAHLLHVDRGRLCIEPYWELDPHRRIRYRDPREYTEQFGELFGRAVADRLRCVGPIGVALSGGLDSSAVAGVAQGLLDAQGAGTRLRSYSTIYPGQRCDESPYIDAVADRWGLISRRVPWDGSDTCPWSTQASTYLDLPDYPFAIAASALYAGARADGVRVLLTGEGGDFWQDGSRLPHRHMLLALRLRDLLTEVRYETGDTGLGNAIRLMTASLLWGLAPAGLRGLIESRRPVVPLPPYLSPAFVRDIGLERRLHCADCADRFPDASQWQIARRGRGGTLMHFYEMMERTAVRCGLELRHPLLDRRLIEFAVAVPDYVRRRGRVDRVLMRQAMEEIYPAAVRARLTGASFGIVFARALKLPEVLSVLESPQLLARPWIAADPYRAFLKVTLADCAGDRFTSPRSMYLLWILFAVEVWCRNGGAVGL